MEASTALSSARGRTDPVCRHDFVAVRGRSVKGVFAQAISFRLRFRSTRSRPADSIEPISNPGTATMVLEAGYAAPAGRGFRKVVKATILVKKKPGMSDADFIEHYNHKHAQMAAPVLEKHHVITYSLVCTESNTSVQCICGSSCLQHHVYRFHFPSHLPVR